jgi:hypothetical protein
LLECGDRDGEVVKHGWNTARLMVASGRWLIVLPVTPRIQS